MTKFIIFVFLIICLFSPINYAVDLDMDQVYFDETHDIQFKSSSEYYQTQQYDRVLLPDSGMIELNTIGSTLWFGLRGVYRVGDYAYVTSYFGLLILDISDPTQPTVVSRLTTDFNANGLIVRDGIAYLAGGNGMLTIVYVVDPESPTVIGEFFPLEEYFPPQGWAAYDVQVIGNTAYVVELWSGLWIIDISNLTDPQGLGFYHNTGELGVSVAGNYAYLVGGTSVKTLDISDPADIWLSNVDYFCGDGWSRGGVVVNQDLLYATGDDLTESLTILDITAPSTPNVLSCFSMPGEAQDLFLTGDELYIGSSHYFSYGVGGLTFLDVTNPTAPVQYGSVALEHQIWCLHVLDRLALVAQHRYGFSIVDFMDPAEPKLLSTYSESVSDNGIRAVFIHDNHAFIANDGLESIDISDPHNPIMMGKCGGKGILRAAVSGDFAYGAISAYGLEQYDITDPGDPQFVGTYDDRGRIFDVTTKGEFIYYIEQYNGLKIITADGPSQFNGIGSFDRENDYYYRLEVYGNYLFITDKVNEIYGLTILDVSDPSNPTLLSRIETPFVRAICFSGNYAYMAVDYAGMQVLDISDINNPQIVATIATYCNMIEDLVIQGNRVYMANWYDCPVDMAIYDISQPTNPLPIANHSGPSFPFGIAIDGKYIYIAGANGLEVVEQSFETICGDMNSDFEGPNITDLTFLVDFMFRGGLDPIYSNAVDINGDSNTDIADLTYFVEYLFRGGAAPNCL